MHINSEIEYLEARKRASKIFDLPGELDPASPEGKAFYELILAICECEKKTFNDGYR